MFTHSTTKISNEHINHIVTSILNKKQRNIIEQQQKFIRRNTDENNKRNNYVLEKYTIKKYISSPKKIIDDNDDDFISIKKPLKPLNQTNIKLPIKKINPIKECIESIISEIENNDAICPICNEILSNFISIDQRQQHVNQCIEKSQINNIETKHQKTLLSYSKFTSTIRKPPPSSSSSSNFKCQICGLSFNIKRSYLSHLKKCSNQNSVQLKHVIHFAAKTTTAVTHESKPPLNTIKKNSGINIKNRIIKMEIPKTEDDEQQQLAIALSASIKTASEPLNAFDILQTASKKLKTIDLLTTPLWNVSIEDKLKLSSIRLSNICERVITITPTINSYKFPPSSLLILSQINFGNVNWWNITTTNPDDDEIPMTQLARILDDDESQ